ncbi:MAG TPA: glycosyltransferase family 2 protein [Rhodopila sp.]
MNQSGGTSVTLCAIVRDEGPYLLEWLAWYRLLGFDQIVIYDNGSADESAELLPALHRSGLIDHRPWPDRDGEQPQLPAYRHATAECVTEWIAFLDADEFLVLHDCRRITDLLQRLPEDCSAVAFNQRFFGSAGLSGYDDRLVIERFTRTSPPDHPLNVWIKTIARANRIKAISNPHSCELRSGYYVEPGGRACVLDGQSRTHHISLTHGQYNHYILKSREEYLKKKSKGRVSVAREDPERFVKYTDAFFALHDQNDCEDTSAARLAEAVRAERDRLIRICGA